MNCGILASQVTKHWARRVTSNATLKRRMLKVREFYESLGKDLAEALPALHALSGCDTTGKVESIGKATWFKCLLNADEQIIQTLKDFGYHKEPTNVALDSLERLLCRCYNLKEIDDLAEARWFFFIKKSKYGSSLPPTRDAWRHSCLRDLYQVYIWAQETVPMHEILDPAIFAWKFMHGSYAPVGITILPAPECVLLELNCK